MTKRSLHFGLNLVLAANYNGWPGFLNACCADAADMAGICARAGFAARGVMNHDATAKRLTDEFRAAANDLVAGDWFLFSFSGHGGRGTAWAGVGTVETLCLFDAQFPDYDLRVLLAEFRAGVNVVLVFDSCHSGGMDRARGRVKFAPAWVTEKAAMAALAGTKGRGLAANVMLLSACRSDEYASDGTDNGAFTGALMRSAAPGMNWAGWLQMAGIHCAQYHPNQHPQLIKVSGSDLRGEVVI